VTGAGESREMNLRATSVAGQLPNLPRGCHIIRPPSWHMSLAPGTRIVPTKSSVSWAPAGWDRSSALEIRSPRSPLTCCRTGRQRQRLPPAVHPRSPDAPDDWDLELRAGACLTCGSWVNRSMNRWIRTRQNRIRVGMERALLDARKVRYHSRRMSRLQLSSRAGSGASRRSSDRPLAAAPAASSKLQVLTDCRH
jgi:hypothetical protein